MRPQGKKARCGYSMSRMLCTGTGFFPCGSDDRVFSEANGVGGVVGVLTVGWWVENRRKWRLPTVVVVGVRCGEIMALVSWLGSVMGGNATGSRVRTGIVT